MAKQWQNDDGLTVNFGGEHAAPEARNRPRAIASGGMMKHIVLDFDLELLSDTNEFSNGISYTTDIDNDGARDGFHSGDAAIPAGAYVTRAYLYLDEAAAGGTSIVVGGYQVDGTVVDADGFFTTILTAALTDGALLGGDADQGDTGADVGVQVHATLPVYPAIDCTGTFTAGQGRLIIEYFDEV